MSAGQKLLASQVQPISLELARLLEPACEWLALAGSLRRGMNSVGDVEIVVLPKDEYWAKTDQLLADGIVTHAKPKGWGPKMRKMVFDGVKFDVFLCDEMNRGYQYWLRTGPAEDNHALAGMLKGKSPFTLHDGYAWYGEKKLRINNEDDWFNLLGFPFIEPKDRKTSLYHRLLTAKTHRYTDVTQFLPREPKQMNLFTAAQLHEAEWQAAIHNHKDKAKDHPVFEWTSPWLHGDRVWVYKGYGEYESLVLADERARARLDVLERIGAVREGDKIRLEAWLKLRESKAQNEKLASVLLQMVNVMRVAA